jgi:NADPH:quinone reductase-like Zn-dependent oxidoreductase
VKALCFFEHGELDVLRYADVPDPQPGPGQVLVRVRACALNHLDVFVRRGWPGLKLALPHWCGADVAGEVAALGEGVTGWSVGQRVVLDPGVTTAEDEFTRRGEHSVSPGYVIRGEQVPGGQAEFVLAAPEDLMPIPDGWDFPRRQRRSW